MHSKTSNGASYPLGLHVPPYPSKSTSQQAIMHSKTSNGASYPLGLHVPPYPSKSTSNHAFQNIEWGFLPPGAPCPTLSYNMSQRHLAHEMCNCRKIRCTLRVIYRVRYTHNYEYAYIHTIIFNYRSKKS